MERQKAIEIKNLNFGYRSNWTMARGSGLKDINLEVFKGESFGFLGQNGAGKTTTIKCLLSLLQPISGSAEIFGCSSTDVKSRNNVGYVPEQPYFYDYLTVEELVRMYATLAGVSGADLNQSVAEALKKTRIEHKSSARLRSLSKGQTQRVAIAQAIVGKPRLLILDEPFSGLDPLGRKEICDLFFSLKEEGTTIFICSHILSDIEFLCDRVSIMKDGKIKGVFDLKDLSRMSKGEYELVVSNYQAVEKELSELADQNVKQDLFLRLHFKDVARAKTALKKALDLDCHIESYSFEHGTLEDLFLTLVGNDKQE